MNLIPTQTSLLGFPHPQPCGAGLEDREGHGNNGQRADPGGQEQPRDPRSSYCGTRLGPSLVLDPNCGTGTAPRGRGSPGLREGAGAGSASRGLRSAPPLPVLPRPAAPGAAPRCGGAAGGPAEPRGRRSPGLAPAGLGGREEGRRRGGTVPGLTVLLPVRVPVPVVPLAPAAAAAAVRPARPARPIYTAAGPAPPAARGVSARHRDRHPRHQHPRHHPRPRPQPPGPARHRPRTAGCTGRRVRPHPSAGDSWETRGHGSTSPVPSSRTLPTSPRPLRSHQPPPPGDTRGHLVLSFCPRAPSRTGDLRPSHAMSPCQADGKAPPAPEWTPPSRSLSSLGSDPALLGSSQAGCRARCRPPRGHSLGGPRGSPAHSGTSWDPRTAVGLPRGTKRSHLCPCCWGTGCPGTAGKGRGQEGAHRAPLQVPSAGVTLRPRYLSV